MADGTTVRLRDGLNVGSLDGTRLGAVVDGFNDRDGFRVGKMLGVYVDLHDGYEIGSEVGVMVGSKVGSEDSTTVGSYDGAVDESTVGYEVGNEVGL